MLSFNGRIFGEGFNPFLFLYPLRVYLLFLLRTKVSTEENFCEGDSVKKQEKK